MSIFVDDEGFIRLRDVFNDADTFPFLTLTELNNAFLDLGFDVVKGAGNNEFIFSKMTETYLVHVSILGEIFNQDGNLLEDNNFEFEDTYFVRNETGGTLTTDVSFAVYED